MQTLKQSSANKGLLETRLLVIKWDVIWMKTKLRSNSSELF